MFSYLIMSNISIIQHGKDIISQGGAALSDKEGPILSSFYKEKENNNKIEKLCTHPYRNSIRSFYHNDLLAAVPPRPRATASRGTSRHRPPCP